MTRPTPRILVVEDDFLQAMDLEAALSKSGFRVLGPVASVEEGMGLILKADAAVLDITLRDREVFPLADMLGRMNVPFVFYTGSDTTDLPARYGGVQLIRKPARLLPEATLRALTAFPPARDDSIENILPKLRLMARLIYHDPIVSDRLVERVLIDAIAHASAWHELGDGEDRSDWLMTRMRRIVDAAGTALMN